MRTFLLMSMMMVAFTLSGCKIAAALIAGEGLQDAIIETTVDAIKAAVAQGAFERENFSPENRYFTGRGVSGAVFKVNEPLDTDIPANAETVEYVNLIGQYLVLLGGAPEQYKGYTFGVVQSKDAAAFSTPGGFIWIGTGAIALCENEDQLAAIIAHETAHAVRSHAMKQYDDEYGGRIFGAVVEGAVGDLVVINTGKLMEGMADAVLSSGYSEEFEFEADLLAVDMLAKTGYDPNEWVTVLRKIKAHIANSDNPGAYLEGHPDINDRIAAVKGYIEEKGYTGAVNPVRTARFNRVFKKG